MKKKLLGLLVAGMLSGSAFAATDDFNRTALGTNWTVQSGSFSLDGATAGGSGLGLATYEPGSGSNSASLDVAFHPGTEYAALVLGYQDLGHNAFIKVQTQNGPGTVDHAAFYYGNNGGGSFFNVLGLSDSNFSMTASLVGSLATLTITGGSGTQTFTHDYGAASFGSGVGVGVYGNARLDNFSTDVNSTAPVPEPETYAMLMAGLGLLGAIARRRKQA